MFPLLYISKASKLTNSVYEEIVFSDQLVEDSPVVRPEGLGGAPELFHVPCGRGEEQENETVHMKM